MAGDEVERQPGREERRPFREHLLRHLAEHLDVPEGILEARRAEIEVVDAERLLKLGGVHLLADGDHGGVQVAHVVAAELPRAVREPARMLITRRREQQRRGVDGAARHDDDVGRELLALAVDLGLDLRDGSPRGIGAQARHLRVSA